MRFHIDFEVPFYRFYNFRILWVIHIAGKTSFQYSSFAVVFGYFKASDISKAECFNGWSAFGREFSTENSE